MKYTNKCRKRKPTSFTLSEDTLARLGKYAAKHHTNKSQAITDLIWAAWEDCPLPQYVLTEEDIDFMESERYAVVAIDDKGNALLSDCSWKWEELIKNGQESE